MLYMSHKLSLTGRWTASIIVTSSLVGRSRILQLHASPAPQYSHLCCGTLIRKKTLAITPTSTKVWQIKHFLFWNFPLTLPQILIFLFEPLEFESDSRVCNNVYKIYIYISLNILTSNAVSKFLIHCALDNQ